MPTIRKGITMLSNASGISTKVECETFTTFVASISANSGSIVAYGTDEDDNATVIMGLNCADWTNSSSISTTGKYNFDITGMKEFYFNASLTATIKGRMLSP